MRVPRKVLCVDTNEIFDTKEKAAASVDVAVGTMNCALAPSGRGVAGGRRFRWADARAISLPKTPKAAPVPKKINGTTRAAAIVTVAEAAEAMAAPELPARTRPSNALRRDQGEDLGDNPLLAVANLVAQLASKGVKLGRVTVLSIESVEVGAA